MEAGAQPLGALAASSEEQERGRIAQQEATGRPWGGVGVWVGLKAAGAEAGTQERGQGRGPMTWVGRLSPHGHPSQVVTIN